MDVDVIGAGPLVNRLARFNKDVYKVLQSEIKDSMRVAATDIRVSMPSDRPLSNWGRWSDSATKRDASQKGVVSVQAFGGRDLSYEPGKVSTSIKFGAKQARIRRVGVVGIRGWAGINDAGGSIFTTAGSDKGRRGSTNSVFVRNLRAKHGTKYPRVLTVVWERHARIIAGQIDRALDRARIRIGL